MESVKIVLSNLSKKKQYNSLSTLLNSEINLEITHSKIEKNIES